MDMFFKLLSGKEYKEYFIFGTIVSGILWVSSLLIAWLFPFLFWH